VRECNHPSGGAVSIRYSRVALTEKKGTMGGGGKDRFAASIALMALRMSTIFFAP